jgi:hypothetical protein
MTRRLSDEALLGLLLPTSAWQQSYRQDTLLHLFPRIHQNLSDPTTSLLDQWHPYKQQHPQGLDYSRFTQLYGEWLSNNGLQKWPSIRWALPIAYDDYKMLRAWRSSNDKRKWQRAVALLDLHRHCTIASICRKLERSPKTIKRWRRMFLTHGLAGLLSPTPARQPNCRQSTLLALFPRIHQGLSDPTILLLDEWKSYKRQHPRGLGYSRFCQLYDQWLSTSGLTKWPRKRWTVPIAHDDYKGAEDMAIVQRQAKVATRCCSSGLAPTLHDGINLPQTRTVSQDDQEMAPHVSHPGDRRPRSPVEEGRQQSTPSLDHGEEGALGQDHP